MQWIVYLDLDAFYVSCELTERPELVGRAVIVGPDPTKGPTRGVVLSASYEARTFGVRSAMPVGEAHRRCPDAIWLPADFPKYERLSNAVRELLRPRAPDLVQLSIDEFAFTAEGPGALEAERIGREVQQEIRERLHLPASLGIAASTTVAKIASDRAKPGGIRVVPPDETAAFLAPLPVRAVPGVGPKTAEVLASLGIETIGSMAVGAGPKVRAALGGFAEELVLLARGTPRDTRLTAESGPRSRSTDHTFLEDVEEPGTLEAALREMAPALAASLARERLRYQTVTVAVRWRDFSRTQKSATLPALHTGAEPLERAGLRALAELWEARRRQTGRPAARTLSLRVERLRPVTGRQRTLPEYPEPPAQD